MQKIHYSIVVKGKVQGVWFRKYTKDKADELGIKGFVQNEFDKTVFIFPYKTTCFAGGHVLTALPIFVLWANIRNLVT